MIRVSNVRIDGARLLGSVAEHDIAYTFPPTLRLAPRGEFFLTPALFIGMAAGADLHFDDTAPLSPKLLAALPIVQSLLKQWNPEFSRVRVEAPATPVPRLNPGVLCAYSGGVDSTCTLVDHLPEITHAMTLNMFDEAGGRMADPTPLFAKNRSAIEFDFGRVFLPIQSTTREVFRRHRIRWDYGHGPFLCLLAAGLGFDRFYMASTYTYRELKPWGSHPLLDPLWSTETTAIVHDGAHHRRSEKTGIVASHPAALKNLQVCWNSKTSNCGACAKCARTLVVLNMLGVQDAPFPRRTNRELLPYLTAHSSLSAGFLWDIMVAARERGEHEVARTMAGRLRTFVIKSSLLRIAEQIAGTRTVQRLESWRTGRPAEIGMVGPRDPETYLDPSVGGEHGRKSQGASDRKLEHADGPARTQP